ncbi:hypothetical protein CKO38_02265 [Rhodospirillum rubrum]|uniref:DUF488 domain-containing protein n=1 Tax=Rhodospirillum rubrum TaxID=1085 RepID=UPI001907E8A6|nr:DUF488 domain-containing protein [Rhodospirillum rubrum]MBK1664811.1 hypothetical protein [Rhodospirillum rubrum]MBK1675516.1 hypothetical protein [Rhodospirillum rubrum]
MDGRVLTVGYASHDIAAFLALVRGAGVTAIADVRSQPFSRFRPAFNRPALKASLRACGLAYVFLGAELGARPKVGARPEMGVPPGNPPVMRGGRVDFDRLAESAAFGRGIDRVIAGRAGYRIALMCAERDPIDCHRALLVGRVLSQRHGVAVAHLHDDGRIESQADFEARLLALVGAEPADLFAPPVGDPLSRAYARRLG